MQLVVGTYERFLLGYSLPDGCLKGVTAGSGDDEKAPSQLQRCFTHAAHQGPVRCLDAGGPWLVSGGQDDQLHIYDGKAGKDLGFMMNPGDGAITCVKLFTPPGAAKPTHLLSGSDDGSIAIWQAGGDWEALKLLRGHKGPIRGLSVHPSGRLAVSVGHDRLLKLWHLGKGRCSYTARLEVEADDVAFSADGESYALLCDKVISLHSVAAEGGLIAKLTHSRRVTAMLLPPPNINSTPTATGAAAGDADNTSPAGAAGAASTASLLLCGLDDGRLCLWDVRAPEAGPVWEIPGAHKTRIRAVTAVVPGAAPGQLPTVLATASSDGEVKLWDSSRLSSSSSSGDGDGDGERRLVLLGSVSTKGRITGMVLSAPEQAAAAVGAGDGVAVNGQGAAAAAAKKQKKQKAKRQQDEGQQQPSAKKQRVQQQQQQQQSNKVPKQQQGQKGQQKQQQQVGGGRGGKPTKQGSGGPQQKHKRRQQQQQRGGDGDLGFEVVPAPAQGFADAGNDSDGGSPPPQQQPQRQQHKQQQQQQRTPGSSGSKQKQLQQKQKQKQQKPGNKQQQQRVGGGGAGGDAADSTLVPRVQTIIKKKKKKPQQQQQGVGGAGGKGRKGSSSKKTAGRKPSSRHA